MARLRGQKRGPSVGLQPLIVFLTTAGFNLETICGEYHSYAIQVRDGVIDGETFLPVAYAAVTEDDWLDEATSGARLWPDPSCLCDPLDPCHTSDTFLTRYGIIGLRRCISSKCRDFWPGSQTGRLAAFLWAAHPFAPSENVLLVDERERKRLRR